MIQANTKIQNKPLQHTHTQPFNSPLFGTTRISQYQKGKLSRDFTKAPQIRSHNFWRYINLYVYVCIRDSEWQCHQLGHIQVCTSLQTDNHASTPPLTFLQAGCSSCCPTNSVKALKAKNKPLQIKN